MYELSIQILRSEQARLQMLSSTDDVLISPLLTQTVLWMSSPYIRVYVLPNQSLYSELELGQSPQLFNLYDAGAVQQIVVTLVELANTFIQVWPYEEAVLEMACENITAVVRAGAAAVLVSQPIFHQLFAAVCAAPQQNILSRVASQSRSKVMECVTSAVISVENMEALEQLNHFVQAR